MRLVSHSTMRGPYTEEDMTAKYGSYWNVVRRFPIEQNGSIRNIDDHTENDNNRAVSRKQTVVLSSVSRLVLLLRANEVVIFSELRADAQPLCGVWGRLPRSSSARCDHVRGSEHMLQHISGNRLNP